MSELKNIEHTEIKTNKTINKNLPVSQLIEIAIKNNEGVLASNGALIVRTGDESTGRLPNNRYVVEDPSISKDIWWGEVNRPISAEKFDAIHKEMQDYLKDKDLYVFDGFIGTDKAYRLPVRVVTQKAWHSLFVKTLFVRPTVEELAKHQPDFTVIDAMDMHIDHKKYDVAGDMIILLNLAKKMILICGTGYGGEMKKGMFSVMNYQLPAKNVFPMHCSANVDAKGDTALFFGLSGTGKTTLSADPKRRLIGDDEHGWGDQGIFNFEGGCYAKVIKLSKEAEPQIYNAIKFGSILENVIYDEKTRVINYDAGDITENTRATYPVDYIDNCLLEGCGDHPKNVFFLTCDAFGVLPPISKLTPEQAMYHFLSGYTAKVAGTEVGLKEPKATFSTCFGAPFLPRHPGVYAKFLGERLEKHQATCWLVNTGWSGGAYGTGKRMNIGVTRALLNAALDGTLKNVEYTSDPIFKVQVPKSCVGVDSNLLNPVNTWSDKAAYEKQARELAKLFTDNFKKYEGGVTADIIAAGPNV